MAPLDLPCGEPDKRSSGSPTFVKRDLGIHFTPDLLASPSRGEDIGKRWVVKDGRSATTGREPIIIRPRFSLGSIFYHTSFTFPFPPDEIGKRWVVKDGPSRATTGREPIIIRSRFPRRSIFYHTSFTFGFDCLVLK
jgi:hypothetical protein